jgi:transcriptional regulator with XRE-family HTH domain
MTNDYNVNTIICAKIAELRRASGLTQDALAEKLGVTYQAVSKWENAISCPDIALIPAISDIFGVSIDALFGRTEEEEVSSETLPWGNDNKLHAVLFRGKTLLSKQEYKKEKMNITLEIQGDVKEIICSEFPVSCHNVEGNISAGSVTCDVVEGDVNAGAITCDTIEGNVNAGAITCNTIEGDLVMKNGGAVTCNGDIDGDIQVDNCKITLNGDMDGDIHTNGNTCVLSIEGDMNGDIDICGANCTVTIEGDMDGDIDVNAEGATLNIEGDVS